MLEKAQKEALALELASSDETRCLSALKRVERLSALARKTNEERKWQTQGSYKQTRALRVGLFFAFYLVFLFTFASTSVAFKAIYLTLLIGGYAWFLFKSRRPLPEVDLNEVYEPLLACPTPKSIPQLLDAWRDVDADKKPPYARALLSFLPQATSEIAQSLSSDHWRILHEVLHSHSTLDSLEAGRFISRFGFKHDTEELSEWLFDCLPVSGKAIEVWNEILEAMLIPMIERTFVDETIASTIVRFRQVYREDQRVLYSIKSPVYRRLYLPLWFLLERRPHEPLEEESKSALLALLSDHFAAMLYDARLPLAIIETLGKQRWVGALPVFRRFAKRAPVNDLFQPIIDACKEWIPVLESEEILQKQAKTLLRAGVLGDDLLRAAGSSVREEAPEHLLRKNVDE